MAKVSISQWTRRLWRLLGSSRLTLILMAALLLASLLSSLFPQMPASSAARAPWLSAVTLRYGSMTPILHALGLFDAYHSAWYLALLAILALNTIACTLQRLPRLWRSLTMPPRVARPGAFYQGFAHQSEWPVSSRQAGLAKVQETLPRRRYRLYMEQDEGATCAHVYAERGRWAEAGTLLTHLSALALVLAVIARPALGWQVSSVTLLPGQTHTVDVSPPLDVRAGTLQIDHHPDGQPRDYRVPLAVVDSVPAITRTVRINHPLNHRGLAFHLQGYGPAARVMTPGEVFDLALSGGKAQEVELREAGLVLRVAPQQEKGAIFVEALSAEGTPLGSGIVADGQQVSAGTLPITFELGRYTVWQVSRDPTFALAVAAASLMLAGTVVSLWVPQRRLWLRVDEGTVQMVGAGDLDGEFEALIHEMATSPDGALDSAQADGHG
jgi:cytochrome c biogenesis protein